MHGQLSNKVVGFIVSSDGDSFGISEVYLSTYVSNSVQGIIEFISKELIGNDIDKVIDYLNNLRIPFAARSGAYKSLIGCMVNSILDLKAKILKVPMYQLLDKSSSIDNFPKIYASGGTVIMTPSELKSEHNEVVSEGYDGYKIRIGLNSMENEIERINSVRDTDLDLMIDAIGGTKTPPYKTEEIIDLANKLGDIDIFWFEEPIDPDDFSGMNLLKKTLDISFAGGEAYSGYGEFLNFINYSNFDVIQIDASFSGSFFECSKVSKFAKSKNRLTASHVWGSAVTRMMNLHLAVACKFDYIENPLIHTEVDSLFNINLSDPQSFKGLLEGHGIGIEYNPDIINKYRFKEGTEYTWKKN